MTQLSLGTCATLACLLEATAPKVGNVHRSADFEDLSFTDFAVSAAIVGPVFDQVSELGVGATILAAVQATQRVVRTNTNLGLVLLIAPLAAVPRTSPIASGIGNVLASLQEQDAQAIYEAIRLARPGGLGEAPRMDVHGPAPARLLDAMQAAADRDLVARQYTNEFAEVLQQVVPWLVETRLAGASLTQAIIHTQVRLLAAQPDSLIVRKCGFEAAQMAQRFANMALDAGSYDDDNYLAVLADLDFWMRSDGHRRNPGTTADLIAAGLFVALRENRLPPDWS
ncbi:MAG: triphosphoribosyl-dephospho-CoA synthase [Planctomycetota bacterium]